MQELRVQLTLDTRTWKRALDSARADVAKGLGGAAQGVSQLGSGLLSGNMTSALGGAVKAALGLGTAVGGVVKGMWLIGRVALSVFGSIISLMATVARTIVSTIGSALSWVTDQLWGLVRIGAAVGAALGAALVAGLHAAFNNARDLVNQSAQTGIGVGSLTTLSAAAEFTGMQPQNLATNVTRLQGSLSGVDPESKKTQDSIKALGLNIASLRAMRPEDQLLAIGKALRSLKDPADKAAVVTDIFSRRGLEMLSFLNQTPEALALAIQQAGKLPDILAKDAGAFAYLSRTIEGFFHLKIRGLFDGIGDALRDQLTYFADGLNKLDFVSVGQRLGKALHGAISFFIGAWNDPKFSITEFITLGLKAAFAEAGAFATSVWSQLGEPLKVALLSALAVVKEGLIYGFTVAAPIVAEILGKAVGAAMALVGNYVDNKEAAIGIASMANKQKLNNDRRNEIIKDARKEGRGIGGGLKSFTKQERDELDALDKDDAKAKAMIDEIEGNLAAANAGRIKQKADEYGAAAGEAVRTSLSAPDPAALKDASKKTFDDLSKIFSATPGIQFTPGQTKAWAAFQVYVAKRQAAGADLTDRPPLADSGGGGDNDVTPAGGRGLRGNGSTDQFSRVGLFASKVTSAGIDYLGNIARNTARAAEGIDKLVSHLDRPSHASTRAVYS